MDFFSFTLGVWGCFGLYILACRTAMRSLDGATREVVMASLNSAGFFYFLIYLHNAQYVPKLALYAAIVLLQYGMLRFFSESKSWLSWLAFFTPILALIVIRYIPGHLYMMLGHAFGKHWRNPPSLIGISYFAFRCSRLVIEVRNGSVRMPGFCQYLGFAFFLPTMSVGPINTYANYRRGFESAPWEVPVGRALLRILVGLVKYQLLGAIFSQVTYSSYLLNGHPHSWISLPIAMAFYYLYLYCNFSGFCDMAIGLAALIGIPVFENFDNPFAARNIKDFWNRWHITLSQWMRDLVFAPLSKYLVRLMGAANANHAIALSIFVVFLLVGVWHGVGWNYAAYGLVNALGLVANHYYTIGLKKWLGREGFKAYNENRWIHAAAVILTFCYCAASLMFFANTFTQIKEIFLTLR